MITRKEAKELLPIIQAFAEGKTIQWKDSLGNWNDDSGEDYRLLTSLGTEGLRIKPESKYSPFKTQEECWNEMHNHIDFGWVRDKSTKSYYPIEKVNHSNDYKGLFEEYEFTDGTPFGVKME